MIDLDINRSGWGMVALFGLGIAAGIVRIAFPEVGDMILASVRALFTGG